MSERIPIVDLFAGPGGLGEGFEAYETEDKVRRFEVRLSIEKDEAAHRTLLLRTFYRQFDDVVPDDYYSYLRDGKDFDREALFEKHQVQAAEARKRARRIELGKDDPNKVKRLISRAVGGNRWWVLIGGPPCQAYSVMGRVRMGFKENGLVKDHRHLLYKEYLKIIADHSPPVFIMENVPGLLSSAIKGRKIFDQMTEDLVSPWEAVYPDRPARGKRKYCRYKLIPLSSQPTLFDMNGMHGPADFVVQAEDYGIPQARHRVILFGIRADLIEAGVKVHPLKRCEHTELDRVLYNLPHLRPMVTKTSRYGNDDWATVVRDNLKRGGLLNGNGISQDVRKEMQERARHFRELPKGGRFVEYNGRQVQFEKEWYFDERLGGVCNHESRRHMWSDICRYFYAACYTKVKGRFPRIADFPEKLWPEHANAREAAKKGTFADRFCVQLPDRPSRTITCHLAKDGHYCIHYDPTQCRSFTVREAARIQTFPDNYFFEGTRTEQYQQVGNAVPPLLARQIASVVHDIIEQARGSSD